MAAGPADKNKEALLRRDPARPGPVTFRGGETENEGGGEEGFHSAVLGPVRAVAPVRGKSQNTFLNGTFRAGQTPSLHGFHL